MSGLPSLWWARKSFRVMGNSVLRFRHPVQLRVPRNSRCGSDPPHRRQLVFAKIVGHHIKCGKKGVGVHHRVASRFGGFEANYRPLAPFLLEQ